MDELAPVPPAAHVARLRDGSEVIVRPIAPQDKQALSDAFDHLSQVSRYQRFLGSMTGLDARTLRYLTEIDHHDHEALIALDGPDGEGVGVARYARAPGDPGTAELAVAVADAWQGRGLGTLLVEEVVARAREEGVRRLNALVLATNDRMLQLFEEHGWRRAGLPSDGTVEVVLDLERP